MSDYRVIGQPTPPPVPRRFPAWLPDALSPDEREEMREYDRRMHDARRAASRHNRRVASNRGFALGMIAGFLIAGLAAGWFLAATDDPYRGVPACTDQIADAGGICHGEPTP